MRKCTHSLVAFLLILSLLINPLHARIDLDLFTSTQVSNLQHSETLKGAVGASVNAAFGQRIMAGDVLKGMGTSVLADVLASTGGDLHAEGALTDAGQTEWHMGSGAVVGGLMGGTEGAIAAAGANLVADLAFKGLAPTKPTSLDPDEQKAYTDAIDRTAIAAKLLTPITVMFVTGGSAVATSTAIASSSAVVNENHAAHAIMEMQQQAMDEETELRDTLERRKEEAFERQGGAGGLGLTDVERQSTSVSGRGQLDDLRSGHNAMETLLEPIVQGSPVEQRPGSPPRRTDTKLLTARGEPTIEGMDAYEKRTGKSANLLNYGVDKVLGAVVQGVEGQLKEAAQNVQIPILIAQEVYGALPSDVKRVLEPAKKGAQTVGGWIGKGVAMFERVGETVGTYVRRKTRDDWSILSQSDAQDLGDLTGIAVSFVTADVVTRGASRAFTAAKAGANALRRVEFLSAFEGAGSGSVPLLRTQVGGIKIGAAAEVTEVSAASSKVTPTLQALNLETPKLSSSKSWMRRGIDGKVKGLDACEWHHVISDKSKFTRDHELWKLAGMTPDSAANKMLLPNLRGVQMYDSKRSIHYKKHFKTVNQNLGTKMGRAVTEGEKLGWSQERYAEELQTIIQEERAVLRSGERKLNSFHRKGKGDRVVPEETL